MKKSVLLGVAAAVALAAAMAHAEGAAKHQFVGAAKCKMCHNTEKQGKIFDKWMASKHAKAFTTLASEESKKIATAKGIADPQKADACLKCHVTGHGAAPEQLSAKWAAAEGVTCESCHGAGGDYWKNEVMKAVAAGTTKGADVGLVSKPDEKTCTGCHNAESPTFKAFVFKEMWAKIEHSIPAAEPAPTK
jgi:hypothetical protein